MPRASSASVFTRILTRSRLRHWHLVSKIAELGTLQAGAAAVGMSQPAATKALSDIEDIVGFPLFDRHWKGARLSAAGAAILPRIRAAMGIFEDCASTIHSLLDGGSSEITVGTIDAAVSPLLSKALLIFGRNNPNIAVNVQQDTIRSLVRIFQDRAIDMALVRCPAEIPVGSAFDRLLTDRYAIVCSADHPALQLGTPTLEALQSFTWLPPPKHSISERDFVRLWADLGTPSRLFRLGTLSVPLMLAALEDRQALTFIPYNLIADRLGAQFVELGSGWGPPLADIGVLYRLQDADSRSPAALFLSALRQSRADLPA